MSDRSLGLRGVIAVVGLLLGGCASDGAMGTAGTTGTSGSGAVFGTTKNIERVAAGAVEDNLNACMARIPKDASNGQRMLAEESCRRDQANRR
ncbi:hypothetical protein [Nitrospira lenta]|uniref:Lipoprotein n=1 Tax=Nitrospira lenta TaxID=1436998 RepID=A0A330L4Y4_9BACT|nr:hypothetical protein [Nitrospira lenta]SPP64747.1 conserved hypothetical protein [Nitrospira lenta]